MSNQPDCISCGAEPTDEMRVCACETCVPLVNAALAGLRPDVWGDGAQSLDPATRAALLKARWLVRQMARAVDALANEQLDDTVVQSTVREIEELFARLHHHDPLMVAAMRLVDLVELAAMRVKTGTSAEEAADQLAARFAEAWPGHSDRILAATARAAVVAWAIGLDERLSTTNAAKWPQVYDLVVEARLWKKHRGEVKSTTPWEVLRIEWQRWRREGGRATAASIKAMKSQLTATP